MELNIIIKEINDYNERYQRPSKQLALSNLYTYQSFVENNGKCVFKEPKEVIYAYYGLLKEASNMLGYYGGCGSVGDSESPYVYAYQLFTPKAKNIMTLQQFKDLFKGIGHITLLKLISLPSIYKEEKDLKYYMVEIETISGPLIKDNTYKYTDQVSYFTYYYGVVTTKEIDYNWYIQSIDYLPEEFLCAPYHSWFYDYNALIGIVYIDNLKMIDKIVDSVEKDGIIYVYAVGGDNLYRLDFVRLTNGHDILLNENIMKDNKWISTDLLTGNWKDFKMSAMSIVKK